MARSGLRADESSIAWEYFVGTQIAHSELRRSKWNHNAIGLAISIFWTRRERRARQCETVKIERT